MVRPMFWPLRYRSSDQGHEQDMLGGKSFPRFSGPTTCRATPTPDICTGQGLIAGG